MEILRGFNARDDILPGNEVLVSHSISRCLYERLQHDAVGADESGRIGIYESFLAAENGRLVAKGLMYIFIKKFYY